MRLFERRLTEGNRSRASTKVDATRFCPMAGDQLEPAIKSGEMQIEINVDLNTAQTVIKSTSPVTIGTQSLMKRSLDAKLRRRLNAVNSLEAIKLKMFIFVVAVACFQMVEAGFFTFYFPNIFKPKGFHEMSDMINSLDDQINSTLDKFSDVQYYWGLLQKLDEIPIENNYPENSACKEIFPTFRDLAIEYVYIDFEYYLAPMERHRQYLIDFRDEWYPAKHKSKAALPREWEQKLLETELQLKIDNLEKLATDQVFIDKRQRLLDIWRNIRRSLDDSVECLYLRYAYRHIAEDINQLALEMNLRSMKAAMRILMKAYERIAKYKAADEKIIEEIEEEIRENERFTINE